MLSIGCGGGGGTNSTNTIVASIVATSATTTTAAGTTVQFTATAQDSSGKAVPNVIFRWASAPQDVLLIDPLTGIATALAPGLGSVVAVADNVASNTVNVTVTPGFAVTGDLNQYRYGATATLLNNGKVLIAGGFADNAVQTAAEIYDPTTRIFTPTGNMNSPHFLHTATLLENGTVLVAGGQSQAGGAIANAEIFDPARGVFRIISRMVTPRYSHTAAALDDGRVLLAGGFGTSSAEVFNPIEETFTPTGPLNTQRESATATLLNDGTVLIPGGLNDSTGLLKSAEIYDPFRGVFHFTGSLNVARDLDTATLLNDGTVLIAGGATGATSETATAELYNPGTGAFTPTASMLTARTQHTATLLGDGTVLIAGGEILNPAGSTSSTEIYDPVAGTFRAGGTLNTARRSHIAMVLTDGSVLLAGGSDPIPSPTDPTLIELGSAELYQPGILALPGLTTISVTPLNPTVSPGNFQKFVATGTVAGNPQVLNSVIWTTSSPKAGTVSNDPTNPGAAVAAFPPLIPPITPLFPAAVLISATNGTAVGSTTFNVRDTGFLRTADMNTARRGFNAVLLRDGTALIVNGAVGAPAELFSPLGGVFTVTGTPLVNRVNATATLLNDSTVLIVGGLNSASTAEASAEIFDPSSGLFTLVGSLNVARYDHTATLLPNGMVLIAGGLSTAGDELASTELYDPATKTFILAANLSLARAGHTATTLDDGRVLFAGGQTAFTGSVGGGGGGIALAEFALQAELYDPATGTFSLTGNLATGREFHTATLMKGGRVLLTGGKNSSASALVGAELYDPVAGTFGVTGSLATGRMFHSATLLTSGMVLVAGGSTPDLMPPPFSPPNPTVVFNTAEIYDPVAQTFSSGGTLVFPRSQHAAVRLQSGMVLLAGGDNTTTVQNNAELY